MLYKLSIIINFIFFRKCYNTNRLLNGYLQLSDRTHLVLDETDLQPGKLDSKGNVTLIINSYTKK